MTRRAMLSTILTMGLLLVVSVAWGADGDNIFQYVMGDPGPHTYNMTRGVDAGSDLDGDGKCEIMVTNYLGRMVQVYEVVGDDSLEWVWGSSSAIGERCRQVGTGDLDNDGLGEIIFVITDGTWSPTYEGGIHVYEWDGVTDNGYGTAAASIYMPHFEDALWWRAEGFAIGDMDGDGDDELLLPSNKSGTSKDALYILSVTGDFQGSHTWNIEGEFLRTGPNPFGGSPINAGIGDMDGDGHKEAIFGIWDNAALYIVEATGPDTYVYQTYIMIDITGSDDVNLDNFVVADLNADDADEVYFNMYYSGDLYAITGGTDVSLITIANNVFLIGENDYHHGMAIGDQDHGPGTDGPDIYIGDWSRGRVWDLELTGADPTNPAHWTRYTLWEDPSGYSCDIFGISVPPVDMDGDGRLEVVGSSITIPPAGKWFQVFEWAGELVPVEMSSFTANAGQGMVELSWRVESEVDNLGFNLHRDGEKIAFVESRGPSDAPRTYTWIDKDVVAGVTYTYRIADVSLDGTVSMHDFVATATPKAAGGVPTTYWFSQNYPNPFNADTHIEFTLAEPGHTTLKIYNTTGQLVCTLVDGHMDARHHKVRWDGRNEYGQVVASGVYFYRLASGRFAETKKMVLVK